jgi:hypothetical protein
MIHNVDNSVLPSMLPFSQCCVVSYGATWMRLSPITEFHRSVWVWVLLCIGGVCVLLVVLIFFPVAGAFVSLLGWAVFFWFWCALHMSVVCRDDVWSCGRFSNVSVMIGNRDSVVGIVTGYALDDGGVRVRVSVGSRMFSSARHPDRLCRPPNLSNGYRGSFSGGKAAGAWSWPFTSI